MIYMIGCIYYIVNAKLICYSKIWYEPVSFAFETLSTTLQLSAGGASKYGSLPRGGL